MKKKIEEEYNEDDSVNAEELFDSLDEEILEED